MSLAGEDTPIPSALQLEFPEALLDVFRACETRCVRSCCGVEAFELNADRIQELYPASQGFALLRPLILFEELLNPVPGFVGSIWCDVDDGLNAVWNDTELCLAYFKGWRRTFAQAVRQIHKALFFKREWLTEEVRGLRDSVLDGRFDVLPILADALEECGCDCVPMLRHLRNGREHKAFCWVADVLDND